MPGVTADRHRTLLLGRRNRAAALLNELVARIRELERGGEEDRAALRRTVVEFHRCFLAYAILRYALTHPEPRTPLENTVLRRLSQFIR